MSDAERPRFPVTPVLVQRGAELELPTDERVYYVLAKNGLFIGRNHPFFRSLAPASTLPAELGHREPFLEPRFPKVPRRLFERIVGFFDRIRGLHGCEASVLLAWDATARRVRPVVPEQVGTISRWNGRPHPIGLEYTPPADLPRGWTVFGDVHSHVDLPAYSSQTDQADEAYSAGLHIVVGKLFKEPPEIWIEAVADGARFKLSESDVIGGFVRRNPQVPQEWIDRVRVEPVSSGSGSVGGYGSYGSYWSASGAGGTGDAGRSWDSLDASSSANGSRWTGGGTHGDDRR